MDKRWYEYGRMALILMGNVSVGDSLVKKYNFGCQGGCPRKAIFLKSRHLENFTTGALQESPKLRVQFVHALQRWPS